MNLHYIKAAIEAATGIKLTIDEVKAYLISEGLCTASRADKITFRGYGAYYGDIPVETVKDVNVLLIEEGIDVIKEDSDEAF